MRFSSPLLLSMTAWRRTNISFVVKVAALTEIKVSSKKKKKIAFIAILRLSEVNRLSLICRLKKHPNLGSKGFKEVYDFA